MADIKQALIAYGKTGNEQYLAAAEKGIDTISKILPLFQAAQAKSTTV